MAKFQLKDVGINQFGGFTPYGNTTTLRATVEPNATGGIITVDGKVTPAVNDVLRIQSLPEGMVPHDLQLIVSTAFKAGVTCSLGIEYVDGVDDLAVPQDPAFFGSGLALSAVARIRTASTKPLIRLPKEVYLIMTFTGAANDQVARADVAVMGELMGPK